MAAKGFAPDDELRKTIAFKIVQALTMQAKRGGVVKGVKRVFKISNQIYIIDEYIRSFS